MLPEQTQQLPKQVRPQQQQQLPQPVQPQQQVLPTARTTAAGVATIESYFGASGAPNTRAITLPRLPIFQLNQGLANDMGRKSTVPATALVAAAAAGKAEAGKAASDV